MTPIRRRRRLPRRPRRPGRTGTVRDPARARTDAGAAARARRPAARGPGRAGRGDERQGQRPGARRRRTARRRAARRRDAEAASRVVSRAAPDRRPARRRGHVRAASCGTPSRPRIACPGASATRPSSSSSRPSCSAGSPTRASTWRWSRSGSAAGSTRPTPGTAASRPSRTSISTTWTGSARRSGHIAREKAAIIERGDRAVTGAVGDALAIVRRRAARLGVPLTIVEPAPVVAIDRDGLIVELPRLGRTRVGLRGRHQAANVAVADAILDALADAGIADRPRRRASPGLRRCTLARPARAPRRRRTRRPPRRCPQPGRRGRPGGRAGRASTVPRSRPADPVDGVDGRQGRRRRRRRAGRIVRARPTPGSSRPWSRRPGRCRPRSSPGLWERAGSPERTRGSGRSGRTVTAEPDLVAALDRALAGPPGPLVVAGSLYLVGAVRARLVDDPLLRDPVPGDNRP